MISKEYKFDAFISYRHTELDKYVAENLHKILESYDLPKSIKEKLNINKKTFRRIFRDQEELPLSSNLEDPIVDALNNSKYLIVICSPRLKDSLWCKKEIETFKKIRGRKNIFCVLVEGEPSDSFPEEVLYDEIEKKQKNGKIIKEKILVEPLAADVRGQNKKEILKKIKEEKLRLIAPMYNLDYDDLRQRHKLRKQRRIIMTSIIVALSCFLFALYTSIMLIKINSQQKILKLHQALSLSSESNNYLNKDDRYEAIKTSYQALTSFNNVKMPYTPEAEYALTESLGLYDIGSSYKSIGELKTKGIALYIKNSLDNKYVAVYDESEEITLFNSNTLDIIETYKVNGMYFDENEFSFIGNDYFSYINQDGNINLVNVTDGSLIKEIQKDKNKYVSLEGSSNGNYLTYNDYNNLFIYNVNEDKIIDSINSKDDISKKIFYSSDNKYLFITTTKENYDINKEDYITFHVIDLNDGKDINHVILNAGYISQVITKDNNAYLLLNRTIGKDFNMLVVSYNYIKGSIEWSKTFDNKWGKLLIQSYPENTNDIAVVSYDTVEVLNAKNGNNVETFNAESEIINIYSFLNKEMYLIFLSNGSVNYLNMEYKNSIEYKGKYELNVDNYIKVVQSEKGFLLIPKNDNRVILYEEKYNNDMVKEDIELDYIKDESIPLSEYKNIKEEYDLINKNLVEKIFYDTNKELLFVNYTNEDIAIYNVNNKKLIKLLNKVGTVNHYFGKDNDNRIYIGDVSDSYILDNNYDKVGHIKSLAKLDDDKVIIRNNNVFYSFKIYKYNDILNIAKDYLNNNN